VAADEGDGLVFVQLGALANDPFEGVIAELGACSVDAIPPLAAVVLDVAGLEDADHLGHIGRGPVHQQVRRMANSC
jgi:hypothetical protein